MGCDIHWFVEVRDRGTGKWEFAGKEHWVVGEEGDWFYWDWLDDEVDEENELPYIYEFRNYRLFAMLAGVRNDYGIEPCALPRGVPPDASPEYQTIVGYWGGDGHSHSWLTLRELTEYDWDMAEMREIIASMKELGDPDNVRAVFFFDN